MFKSSLYRTLAFFWLVLTGIVHAGDTVLVENPVVRAVPPVLKTTAAFMQVTNLTASPREIVAAESPAAGIIELHMHTNDNGVMRMRRIPHIHLPPGEPVRLQPGGLHLMVFELKRPLKPGEEVPLELTLDDGTRIAIRAVVGDVKMMKH